MIIHENICKKNIGLFGTSRKIQKIRLLKNKPTIDEMKEVANFIWSVNKDCHEFTIFFYLPGMKSDESAYAIFEFNEKELKFYKIHD